MEVIDSRCTLLTNAEVYQLLQNVKSKDKPLITNQVKGDERYPTILYETLKYFNDTPRGPHLVNKNQITKLIKELKKFVLTPAELLQIINLRPKEPIEVQLIVEESEERLTEEQTDVSVFIYKTFI